MRGDPTVFETGGWRERIGMMPEEAWTASTAPDLDALRAYAVGVNAATQTYLAGLEPSALEDEIEGPRGTIPRHRGLTVLVVFHKLTHAGEISALLGCQGQKGFPV